MASSQDYHWDLLMEVDDRGVGLTEDEIEFVSTMIDDERHGRLTNGQMARIRAIHRSRVERADPQDEDL